MTSSTNVTTPNTPFSHPTTDKVILDNVFSSSFDYDLTGLGLGKWTYTDGSEVYYDLYDSEPVLMNRADATAHIKIMRQRGTLNVRFADDDITAFLSATKHGNTKAMWSFFEGYAVILAELYPKEDILKILSQELIACISTKGIKVSKMFENFFTLMLRVQPTPDQYLTILEILHPSDVQKIQQMFGFLASFNCESSAEEQMFDFFQNMESFAKNAAETSSDLKSLSERVSKTIDNLSSKLEEVVTNIKDVMRPGGPAIETLGFIGTVIITTYENLPYVIGKLAFMVTQGCTVERFVDLLSSTGMLRYLLTTFGDKLSHLLLGGPEEQINLGPFLKKLLTPDGFMSFWKLDRGITGIMSLCNHLKQLLIYLGVIPDKFREELVKISRELDDLEHVVLHYNTALVEDPRSLLDPTHIRVVHAHVTRLQQIFSMLETTKDTTHRQRCAMVKQDMTKLYTTLLVMQQSAHARVEPMGVCTLGAGGIGKSSLISQTPMLLAKRVAARQQLPEDQDRHLPHDTFNDSFEHWQSWSQNQTDRYYSGYIGQEFHNVDDGFQDRTDQDHLAYFNLISSVPFPTNQADLTSKGRPYTSRVVQVSANHFPTRSETVRDVKALARRFTLFGVKFNGTPAQYQAWLQTEHEFDPTFAHLQFYTQSGYNYVLNQQNVVNIGQGHWRRIALQEYLDMIIDGCIARQRIFKQRVYAEEQIANTNVDMNLWTTYYSSVGGIRCKNFFNIDGDAVTNIQPTDPTKSFHRVMHTATFGRFHAREFQSHWDIDRVLADINTESRRHIGNKFTCAQPVDFMYQVDGRTVGIHFPEMGEHLNVETITVSDTTAQEEDSHQYAGQFAETAEGVKPNFPSQTVYERLVAFLERLFQGAKDMVNWVLYTLKAVFFPDMTSWDPFERFAFRFTEVYFLVLALAVLIGYFFGIQMLGDVPTCSHCQSDTALNYDLLVQWALIQKVHKKKCGYLRCSDECRWLKNQRFPTGKSCTNEVGVLFWKKKCAYAKDTERVEKMQKLLKKLHDEDPGEVGPYALACEIVENTSLPDQAKFQWMAQIENTFVRAYNAPVTYTRVQEEGEEFMQLNTFLVDSASLEGSGESKKIIRKRASLQSGDSKKIVRKSAKMESGDSKRIVRKNARVEASYSQKSIPCEDGTNLTAHIRLPGACLDTEAFEEFNSFLDTYPETGQEVAEQYGLRLNKVNPEKISLASDEARLEASADPNLRLQAGGITEHAVYVLSDNDQVVIRGIPISTERFILPAHTTIVYSIGDTFPISYKGSRYSAKIEKTRPEWDIAIAVVQGVQLKSMYKFIPSEGELVDRMRSNTRAIICIPNRDKQVFMINVNMILHKEFRIKFVDDSTKSYDHLWVATNLISQGADTQKGDCGSPVMLLCPKTQKKLVGFHIVGAREYSAFAVLTQERVQSLLPLAEEEIDGVGGEPQVNMPTTVYPTIANELFETIRPSTSADPIYAPVGEDKVIVGKRAFEMPSAGKTAIQKHPCHGAFPVTTIPAFLSDAAYNKAHPDEPLTAVNPDHDEVQINLVTKNTSKWCKKLPSNELIKNELAEMEQELTEYWQSVFEDEDLSMISMEDAVSGNPVFGLEPMNIKSSPGIPYNTQKGITSKAALVERTGHQYMNGKEQLTPVSGVREKVYNRINLAKEGKRSFSLWKDCLKDETRPVKKVHQGKTRIFTAAPFDFSIAVRVMMGKMKAIWQKKGAQLGHAVGIDCLSPDWGALYARLSSVSDHGFDCDYSSYDGNLRADFMFAAVRIFAKTIAAQTHTTMYGVKKEDVERTIMVICSECIETFQQSGDVVWLSRHGNPSGNPLTTELNCTVNFMYHWFCFRQILGADQCSLRDFFNRVGFACFGDDAIFVLQDVDKVTFEKLAYWMDYLGQDYTNAAKTGSESELLHLTELSFLKRNFRPDPASRRVVQSPIEEDSILGQFNWCSYPSDSVDILQDTYENALIEMAQLGRERFDLFVSKLHPRMNSHLKSITGSTQPTPKYKSYRGKLVSKLTK